MKRKTIFISAISLVAVSVIAYLIYQQKADNRIRVTVDENLSIDKVKIELGFYSINCTSDENLVEQGLDKVIFLNKPKDGFETICGENDFYIAYDNSFYTIVRHFIPNDFYNGVTNPHIYNFKFQKQADKIYVTIQIEGEYPETFMRPLQYIGHASDNLWGRPLKTTSQRIR